jgi:2-dehydro-3-deoxygluconokinase
VFTGLDEAERLWGTGDALAVRDLIGGRLVVTDGAIGAHAFVAGSSWFVRSLPVEVLEPVGAGDAFAAGYLAAELTGRSVPEALGSGHRCAAAVLGSTGDVVEQEPP